MTLACLAPPHRLRAVALYAAMASVSVGLTRSGTAAAQEPSKAELAKARTLFQEGVALASANNCAAALAKYKEVAQVKSTPQVAFNTAECEARLGRLVSALGNYRVAASQAADDKRAKGVLQEVPARIDELEARIPKLTIKRGSGSESATVELDGTEIGSAQLGVAIPVDPGPHQVVARVGNKQYLHETVTLAEKETKTFNVKISVAAEKIEPPALDQPPGDTPAPSPAAKSRTPGIAVTAVGGAALVAGLAFLAPRGAAIGKLSMDCSGTVCPAADQSTYDQGRLFTGLTEVFVPVGVAAAVVGILMIVNASPAKVAKPSQGDEDKDKKDTDGEKKDAVWRSLQVVAGAPGANVGGLGVMGRF
jgi:hypothetical protein